MTRIRPLVDDEYGSDVRRGRVIGTTATSGRERRGVDRTRSMSADGGALRIRSLIRSGWGTATISYGPCPDDAVALAVLLLNGHNTAQHEPLGQSLPTRIKQWLKGNETEPWRRHLWSFVRHGRRRWAVRRLLHWALVDWQTRRGRLRLLDESLSVGFLPGPVDADPLATGHSFVVHATGAENGELWVPGGDGPVPVLRGVQNVPLGLVVVMDRDSITYLAGSLPGARALPALPLVRPLAVVPRVGSRRGSTFAAIQQAVSGQIGFAADTRVYRVRAATFDGGELVPTLLTATEVEPHQGERLWPGGEPVGLIRISARPTTELVLRWRAGRAGGWWVRVSSEGVDLRRDGPTGAVVISERDIVPADGRLEVQLSDDGKVIGLLVNGRLAGGRWIEDEHGSDRSGVAVQVLSGTIHEFQTYPRTVVLPPELRLDAPELPCASRTVLDDRFDGPAGPLEGSSVGRSAKRWRRTSGAGEIVVNTTGGAEVVATVDAPAPGRVTYTTSWEHDGAVELEVDVLPPGTSRGQGHRGRAGVVFEQDDGDALIVSTWLDDGYDGASISSFFRLGGYEDLYDAIWTNVGRRIEWGRPYRLRVAFDGELYTVWIDDEIVLYRRLTDVHPRQVPLRVERVGMVANWEWGTDTGSRFHRFTARSR